MVALQCHDGYTWFSVNEIKFQELNEGIKLRHLTKTEAAMNSASPFFSIAVKDLKEIELCIDTNDDEHSPVSSVRFWGEENV